METSLKTGFAQIFSRCPKNLSCPKFGGAAAPLAPPARTPMGKRNEVDSPVVIIMASDICSKKAFKCSVIFSRSMISRRKN